MWKIINILIIAVLISACASLKIDQNKLQLAIDHAVEVKNDAVGVLNKIDRFSTSIDKDKVKSLVKNIEVVSDKVIALKGKENISIETIDSLIDEAKVVYVDAEELIKPHFSKLPKEIQSKLLLIKSDLENTYATWKTVSSPNNVQAVSDIVNVVEEVLPLVKTVATLLI